VKVKAKDEDEAIELVQEMYDNEEIVLGGDDFSDVNFDIASE
jgi:hypothetical protein